MTWAIPLAGQVGELGQVKLRHAKGSFGVNSIWIAKMKLYKALNTAQIEALITQFQELILAGLSPALGYKPPNPLYQHNMASHVACTKGLAALWAPYKLQ